MLLRFLTRRSELQYVTGESDPYPLPSMEFQALIREPPYFGHTCQERSRTTHRACSRCWDETTKAPIGSNGVGRGL